MARKAMTGRVVQAAAVTELIRRTARVARSPEVQQRAKEIAPAAGRLLTAVSKEWRR